MQAPWNEGRGADVTPGRHRAAVTGWRGQQCPDRLMGGLGRDLNAQALTEEGQRQGRAAASCMGCMGCMGCIGSMSPMGSMG